jgi:hypothetical protein
MPRKSLRIRIRPQLIAISLRHAAMQMSLRTPAAGASFHGPKKERDAGIRWHK